MENKGVDSWPFNLDLEQETAKPQDCEHCLFGILSPDRFAQKKAKRKDAKDAPPVHHCTINPPMYPSGHPVVEGKAVCTLFTERGEGHNQPLRSLTFPNGTPGFAVTMKG